MHIQVDLALQRLANNKALYVNLALRFPDDVEKMLAGFRTHLAEGKLSDAAVAMHTLKSVAGSVGAHELAELAMAIESRIKRPQHALDTPFDAVAACRELELLAGQTLPVLARAVTALRPEPQSPPNASLEQDILKAMLDELAALLEGKSMRALSVFAQLQYQFGPPLSSLASPGLRALAEAMNNLDFKSAHEGCRLLRSELERAL